MIVGVVAGLACFDARMRPLGTRGALHRALKGDLGAIALPAIALGLTADAVWQMVRAAVDADRVGPGITGATNRVAWIVTGITHFGLAIAAFKIALGIRQSTAESGVKRWTELIMSLPFGPWLVAALGIVVIGVGLVMLYRGWTGDVDRWLNLTELPPTIRAIVMGLGRFGLVARGGRARSRRAISRPRRYPAPSRRCSGAGRHAPHHPVPARRTVAAGHHRAGVHLQRHPGARSRPVSADPNHLKRPVCQSGTVEPVGVSRGATAWAGRPERVAFRGATRLCRGAPNVGGFRGATRLCRGAPNVGGFRGATRLCRGAPNVGGFRGATRLCRGAPNVGGVWGAMSGPPMYSVPDLDGHRTPRSGRRPCARHGHGLRPDERCALAPLHAHAHRRRRRRHREVPPPVRAAALAAGERARHDQSRRRQLAVEVEPVLPRGVQRPVARHAHLAEALGQALERGRGHAEA